MDKTIVVEVQRLRRHPRYERVVRRRKRFMAHDEENTCRVGDLVRIEESRPLSRHKRWRLIAVLARTGERRGGPPPKEAAPDQPRPEQPEGNTDSPEGELSDTESPEPAPTTHPSPEPEPMDPGNSEGGHDNTSASVDEGSRDEAIQADDASQGETQQEPESPDERHDVGGQPTPDTPEPKPTEPGVSESGRGDTGANADEDSRDEAIQADDASQGETQQEPESPDERRDVGGQPAPDTPAPKPTTKPGRGRRRANGTPQVDKPLEPFAKRFSESQKTTPSEALDRLVVFPPGGSETGKSASEHTQQSAQFGRSGAYVTKPVRRWQLTEAAAELEGRFRSMVLGDYDGRCQICGTTFGMSNGELQVFVIHIVPPSKDPRTNNFGNLVGLCGWHAALVRYGEWALLDPETRDPCGEWEHMRDSVLKASKEIDEEGNPYVGLPVRFWNVYQGWKSTPGFVDEEIRYSIPHWTYLRELLSI